MATNETTTFADGNVQTGKQQKKNTAQSEIGWQSVTIGGVTGILMGAGAMYAATAFGAVKPAGESLDGTTDDITDRETADGLRVAEVDQNLSFGQAFEAARAAVGAGGVFHWHGNIYNTYTEAEWNGMSAGQRAQFAQQVQPEIRPGEGQTHHSTNDHAHVDHKPEEAKQEEPKPQDQPQEPQPEQKPDNDVHFLGFANVNIDGQEYEAGHLTNNGQHVYYVDLDNDPDGVFDIRVSDQNHDGKLTMDEAVDVRELHATEGEFAVLSIMEAADGGGNGGNQTAIVTQDEIGNGLPDYMNDANPVI